MARAVDRPSKAADDALLCLQGGGHETRFDPSYFWDARERRPPWHFTIQLTIAGEAFYEDATGRHALTPGHAFAAIIPGPFKYGYPPGARQPYEQVFVSMAGASARRWHGRIHDEFGPVLRFGVGASIVQQQMLEIAHARAGSAWLDDRYLASAKLYQLLMTIYSVLRERRLEQRPRVARAIDILQTQATDPRFNVERLAEIVGCSREHLTREFRIATHQTPGDHLTRHRLRLAGRLLRESDAKLQAVALASGFRGANYFCRVFKQHAGVTPGEFRERKWMTVG
ncbi:MAG: AraC family transcriptional regulator [Tepidisphaeraceae bacterium]